MLLGHRNENSGREAPSLPGGQGQASARSWGQKREIFPSFPGWWAGPPGTGGRTDLPLPPAVCLLWKGKGRGLGTERLKQKISCETSFFVLCPGELKSLRPGEAN